MVAVAANVEMATLGSVIKTAYESEPDTNAFTDEEKTKVAGLGTAAAQDIDAFATGAEGDLAASALQPEAIDTLAELNSLVSDATLIDTGDPRLSDARTPTAHDQAWSTITDTPTTVAGYGLTDATQWIDLVAEPAMNATGPKGQIGKYGNYMYFWYATDQVGKIAMVTSY